MTTQELTKEVVTLSSTVAGHSEKIADACSRLAIVEKDVREQGKLLQSIDKLAMGLTRLDEKMGDLSCKIDNFGNRIGAIELRPAKRWDQITMEVIKYLVLAGIGYAVAKLLT